VLTLKTRTTGLISRSSPATRPVRPAAPPLLSVPRLIIDLLILLDVHSHLLHLSPARSTCCEWVMCVKLVRHDTSLKSTDASLSFCRLYYASISIWFYSANSAKILFSVRWCVTFVLSHSRSKIGTNWKPACDFLLVFHCNYVPIFSNFRDITIYWWKISVFRQFCLPQSHLKP